MNRLCLLVLLLLGWSQSALVMPTAKVAILEIDINGYQLQQAIGALEPPPAIDTRFFTLEDLENDPRAKDFVSANPRWSWSTSRSKPTSQLHDRPATPDGRAVYGLNQASNPEELAKKGFVFDREIMAYYRHMSLANMVNLVRLAAHRHIDKAISYQPVEILPEICLHHPDAPRTFSTVAD